MNYIPYILILLGGVVRLIPHTPNFAPIGALALFGGVYLPKKWSLFLPVSVMVITDYFIGYHQTVPYVYASFILIGMIGYSLRNRKTLRNTVLASLAGSVFFFLVTNFGVWANGWYPATWQGLADCYVKAIPFFRNTLISDLVYTGVLFGGYETVKWLLGRKVLNQDGSIINLSQSGSDATRI